MAQVYKGRQLTQAVNVGGLLNGRSVTTMQAPYLLTEADFLRLKGGPPATATVANLVLSGVVGYGISLGPKIVPLFNGGDIEVTSREMTTLIGSLCLVAVLYMVGFFCPNEKKRTMRKIATHFDNAPPSSHVVGGLE